MEGLREIKSGAGVLTIEQLAEYLQLSVGTIYYWVHRREIPFLKIGKHLRFNINEVMAHFGTTTRDRLDRGCLILRKRISHSNNGSLTIPIYNQDADHAGFRRKE
ncbi:MAG: hypothetical protein A2583_13600 [Bdellovibrionales bacterium RIFOXYD1_FULL_53_11]|nr:MAG: hypothetical protein A2583_13600 [Bdellovibrionales bacterium RIFOXYD1_FULL_53_11]